MPLIIMQVMALALEITVTFWFLTSAIRTTAVGQFFQPILTWTAFITTNRKATLLSLGQPTAATLK